MAQRILILDGHPDQGAGRLVHALAAAYEQGAREGRHEVISIRVADLEFPLLRTKREYESGEPAEAVRRCQAALDWATHVAIFYPLWLGEMPALLKGLLEQMLRPGFAFSTLQLGRWPVKLLSGKSARVVVTMGMPAWVYRWYFRAHSLRSVERNILRFVGFRRIRTTLIGDVERLGSVKADEWLTRVRSLGREGR